MKPKGIFILNGCLPPPYGGIAKYLSSTLPELVSEGYRICAAMPRNYGTGDYSSFKHQGINILIPRDETTLSWVKALRLFVRYFRWIWDRCFRHRLDLKETLVTLHAWLPECDDFLKTNSDDYQLIHVYDAPWAQGWVGRILSDKHRKPLVITTFGEVVPHENPLKPIDHISYRYRALCAEVLTASKRISSPTAYCASKVSFLGADPSKVFLTNHVSGMEEFAVRNRGESKLERNSPALQGKRLVLFAGQIQERKGPRMLLDCASKVLRKYPEVVFAFVGPDCGALAELKAYAASEGVSDSCVFTGEVTETELINFYQSAEIFTFTTISPIECLGLTFVQAMYSGCAVVAARISGVPEVIRDRENGLLFTPGDTDALLSCVLELLANPGLRKAITLQARADVERQFPKKLILNQIRNFYDI